MRKTFLFILSLLFVSSIAFATSKTSTDKEYLGNDHGSYFWIVQSDGDLMVSSDSTMSIGESGSEVASINVDTITVTNPIEGAGLTTEYVSGTTDTITAADDGKTIIYTAATNKTITMPAVSSFTKGITLKNGNGNGALIINPDDGDTYKNGVLALDAGDKISNTNFCGASATINGSGTTGYVTTTGTWTDGGA